MYRCESRPELYIKKDMIKRSISLIKKQKLSYRRDFFAENCVGQNAGRFAGKPFCMAAFFVLRQRKSK